MSSEATTWDKAVLVSVIIAILVSAGSFYYGTTIMSELSKTSDNIAVLTGSVTDLTTSVSGVATSVSDVATSVAALATATAAELAAITADITAITGDLTAITGDLAAIEARLAAVEEAIKPPPVTLRITYGDPWAEWIEPAIDDFEAATGTVISRDRVPGGGEEVITKVTIDLAAGIAADIIMADGFMIPDYAEAGYLLPLYTYVPEWPAWDSFYDGMKEMGSFKGVPYGIALETAANAMLWYWKANMVAAGIPLPWQPTTWDEVLTVAETIKANVPEVEAALVLQGPGFGEGATMHGFYPFLLGATTPVLSPENKLRDWDAGKWIGKSPAILGALEFNYEVFVNRTLAPVEWMYVPDTWGNAREKMRTGKIGMYVVGSWEWAEFWPADIRPTVEERKALVGYAKVPGKEGGFVTISGGWTMAINSETENPDLAWDFLETLFEKERHAKWLASAGKLAPRSDAQEVPEYAADEFLADVAGFMEFTTVRDTYPGYSVVSKFVQDALDRVLGGETPTVAMDKFYDDLVAEFGAPAVKTIPIP